MQEDIGAAGQSRRAVMLAGALAALAGAVQADQTPPSGPSVVALVYPGMVMLDLAAPLTVFMMLGARVRLAWHEAGPLRTDIGLPVAADTRFEDCPARPDIVFVPGGLGGSVAAMGDARAMDFLAAIGAGAGLVTSVCTGGLVLAAAGLLRGYRATTHWYVRDLLPQLGAIAAPGRVVEDRNRITAGGVTAGLDFGLTLAARIAGVEAARRIQLLLEYDPHPPFDAGSPERAGPVITADVLRRRAPALDQARAAAAAAARRLAL